jgi:hypothetical protein
MLRRAGCTGAWVLLSLAVPASAQEALTDPTSLAKEHEAGAFVAVAAPCLSPELLAGEIARLAAAHPKLVAVETIGASFLGKNIQMVSIGRGPKSILLWSQMHGDEPSATPALLDLADFLARHESQPEIVRILETFTLRMIPMMNPDGAGRYERRNAQGIDINRDALMLTTPEGRLLKSVRDRFKPMLGFNLHDQTRRTTVGETGILSSISLLAVAGDSAGTMTPGRKRAQRAASTIALALGSFVPGGIARYDEDWNPRAFGDNITAWGTPVVLIESGGFPAGGGFKNLTRLNFVALVSILEGLSRNDLADIPPGVYDRLLRNRADAYADVAILGASILEPRSGKWFEADVAFDVLASDQTVAGCAVPARAFSRVVEIGDSRVVTPGRRINGRGMLVAPLSRDLGLKPGEITPEALWAIRPDLGPKPDDPGATLLALRLSEEGLSRNGQVSFVAWIPPRGDGAASARYVVVVDGVGLDPS